MNMGNVKGVAWKQTAEYLVKRGGPDIITKITKTLSPEDQAVFSKTILPITWVDYGAFIRFMIAADKIVGTGSKKVIKDASIYNAQQDFKSGIYKIFFSVMSVKFLVMGMEKYYRQYNDQGKTKVEWDSERSGNFIVTDYPEIPLYHEYDQLPYMEEAMRIVGCKNIVGTHPECIARGDRRCVYRFVW
jgi:hypothetical protein